MEENTITIELSKGQEAKIINRFTRGAKVFSDLEMYKGASIGSSLFKMLDGVSEGASKEEIDQHLKKKEQGGFELTGDMLLNMEKQKDALVINMLLYLKAYDLKGELKEYRREEINQDVIYSLSDEDFEKICEACEKVKNKKKLATSKSSSKKRKSTSEGK